MRPTEAEGLLVRRRSPVHRLPAQVKLAALVAFMLAVVAAPVGAWGVLAAHGALLLLVVAAARLPPALVARRAVVELPVVVFALLLPLVAAGPWVQLGPLRLSEAGLLGGATLLAKATIGVVAAVVLAATTAPRDLLAGLHRLRVPAALVAILGFMVRYVAVVGDDLRRMRTARRSRGEVGRPRRLSGVAASVAALFVRSYERGARVHAAMLSRGYTGRVPSPTDGPGRPAEWAVGLALPALAAVVLVAHSTEIAA